MQDMVERLIGLDGRVFPDRRSMRRRRSLKGATLRFNNGYGALECVVRNLSEGGAMLSFGDSLVVPSYFEIRMNGEDEWRTASARWRGMTEVGIAFENRSG